MIGLDVRERGVDGNQVEILYSAWWKPPSMVSKVT